MHVSKDFQRKCYIMPAARTPCTLPSWACEAWNGVGYIKPCNQVPFSVNLHNPHNTPESLSLPILKLFELLPALGEVWSLRSAHSFHMLSGSGCQSTPLQQSLLRLGFTGRGWEQQTLVSHLKLSKWCLNQCNAFSNHLETPSSHGSQQHSQISEDKGCGSVPPAAYKLHMANQEIVVSNLHLNRKQQPPWTWYLELLHIGDNPGACTQLEQCKNVSTVSCLLHLQLLCSMWPYTFGPTLALNKHVTVSMYITRVLIIRLYPNHSKISLKKCIHQMLQKLRQIKCIAYVFSFTSDTAPCRGCGWLRVIPHRQAEVPLPLAALLTYGKMHVAVRWRKRCIYK